MRLRWPRAGCLRPIPLCSALAALGIGLASLRQATVSESDLPRSAGAGMLGGLFSDPLAHKVAVKEVTHLNQGSPSTVAIMLTTHPRADPYGVIGRTLWTPRPPAASTRQVAVRERAQSIVRVSPSGSVERFQSTTMRPTSTTRVTKTIQQSRSPVLTTVRLSASVTHPLRSFLPTAAAEDRRNSGAIPMFRHSVTPSSRVDHTITSRHPTRAKPTLSKPTTRTARPRATRPHRKTVTAAVLTTAKASPTLSFPTLTCASARPKGRLQGLCNVTLGEVCIDTSAGPVCINESIEDVFTDKREKLARQRGRATTVPTNLIAHSAAQTLSTPPTAIGRSGPGDMMNTRFACKNNRECKAEWNVCCPGQHGDPSICSDADCNTNRKPGRPCLGIFMQLECPQVCGLCDNHDLVRSVETKAAVEAVNNASRGELERLQSAFRSVLPVVRLGMPGKGRQWGRRWENTVIIVTVSFGFLDFFRNWQVAAARVGFKRYLVVAEDAAAFRRLQQLAPGKVVFWQVDRAGNSTVHNTVHEADSRRKAHAVKNESEVNGDPALTYSSTAYKSLVNRRPLYIRALLGLGLNVVYTDIDSVWMGSPFRGFTGNHTLWVQSDMRAPTDYVFHSLCTGFMAVRPTPGTIELMLDWEHALTTTLGARQKGNQFIFNTVSWRHIRLGTVSIKPLEPKLFPSGALTYYYPRWLSRQDATPLVIHNNYMVGHDKKRATFVSHGLWFVD